MKGRKVLFKIARVSVFGALAIILYMVPGLQFPIIPGLSFLKLHFDDIPCLIAGLAYGPFTGSLIVLIKSLFKLIQDIGETGGIGVLADFIYGLALVLPASFIYKYFRSFKGGIVGIIAGLILNLLFSSFLGYYIIYPLYGYFFSGGDVGGYKESLQFLVDSLFSKADSSITSWNDPKIMYQFLLPFNLIKNAIVVGVSLLCYKPISIITKKVEENDNAEDKEVSNEVDNDNNDIDNL